MTVRSLTVRSLVAAAAASTLLTAGCGASEDATIHGLPTATPAATPTDVLASADVLAQQQQRVYELSPPADAAVLVVPDTSYSGWALLDRGTGTISGSPDAEFAGNTLESMVKPWIVADYLRRLAESGQQPSAQVLDELTLVIIDSNDPLAESYYQQGGALAVLRRIDETCGLQALDYRDTWWSTIMTPADAVRYGQCIADGRAAGPQWTGWLLQTMTQVRGTVDEQLSGAVQGGRWGIIDGLPPELAAEVSIKNGFTSYVDGWHVNCLAIHRDWVLAIMMRSWAGLAGAAEGCASVTRSLVVVKPAGG